MNDKTKVILRNLFLAIIVSSIMVFIPQAIGFGKEAFAREDLFKQFQFYTNTGWGFLLILSLVFISVTILGKVKKGFDKYSTSVSFASQGELPSIPFFKRYSSIQIFLFSMIAFSVLGLVNFLTRQVVFTGVGRIAQQFTPVDNILYSSALIPAAENLGSACIIALALLALIIMTVKKGWSENTFRALSFAFIPILNGIYGLTNHLLRYGARDYDLMIVFLFWFIGGFITLFVGSFIPFWVMHINNNLFIDLRTFFSSEVVVVWTIFSVIVLIFFYVIIYYVVRKRKKPINKIGE